MSGGTKRENDTAVPDYSVVVVYIMLSSTHRETVSRFSFPCLLWNFYPFFTIHHRSQSLSVTKVNPRKRQKKAKKSIDWFVMGYRDDFLRFCSIVSYHRSMVILLSGFGEHQLPHPFDALTSRPDREMVTAILFVSLFTCAADPSVTRRQLLRCQSERKLGFGRERRRRRKGRGGTADGHLLEGSV